METNCWSKREGNQLTIMTRHSSLHQTCSKMKISEWKLLMMFLWIWNRRNFRPILGEWKPSHLLFIPNHLSFDLLSFFSNPLTAFLFSLLSFSGLDYRFLSHESRKLQTNDWEWRLRLKMLSSLSLIWFSLLSPLCILPFVCLSLYFICDTN